MLQFFFILLFQQLRGYTQYWSTLCWAISMQLGLKLIFQLNEQTTYQKISKNQNQSFINTPIIQQKRSVMSALICRLWSNNYQHNRLLLQQIQMDKELLDIGKQQMGAIKPNDCMNINVGVLGHVDSGKTSICRVLTQVASTASLDKSPQSKQRGITLDLGFSSFVTRVPEALQAKLKQKYFQFTLVDCPGHASLIRTIIGGAQIIDLMFLVIDINKGIQTQTAQCIIIAEMFIKKLIVVINKVDSLEEKLLAPKTNALRKIFSKTKFGQNVTIVPYSTKENIDQYCKKLKTMLLLQLELPKRQVVDKKFIMLADHCFKIKGKGTILTGTVIEGRVKVGDEIQICEVQQKSKIKSMEIFRKPVMSAQQGDRVAMLMIHLEAENIQRALICWPNSVKKIEKFVMDINKIRLYKRPIKNKMKFHIISGHQTVMGELRLFYSHSKKLNLENDYLSINDVEQIHQKSQKMQKIEKSEKIQNNKKAEEKKEMSQQTESKKQMVEQQKTSKKSEGNMIKLTGLEDEQTFAIVSLEKEIWGVEESVVIGYKYDIENDEKQCRLAFHGKIQLIITADEFVKLYKDKVKRGVVDRVVDNYTLIVKDLFSKEMDIQQFAGKEVTLTNGQTGRIEGAFGKSGKIRVIFKQMLNSLELQGQEVSFAFRKWYH